LALRHPLSEPTWAKPITAPSRTAGSSGGISLLPLAEAVDVSALDSSDAEVAEVAAEVTPAAAVVLGVVAALLPHAAAVRASAATAATARVFLSTAFLQRWWNLVGGRTG
jgi:hypothetical protein